MNCASTNLIYVITCKGCGENYIGQTGNELRKRMTVHKQQIRDPKTRMIPLSGHISDCARNKSPYLTVFPFYKFHNNPNEQERNLKEREFIETYRPKLNKLNF